MKIEDIDIYHLPLWACAVVDEISEGCKNRLKVSPEYSRIEEESDKLLFKYPFISKLIDRDEIEEPMDLTLEQTKEARFMPSLVQNRVQIGVIFNGNNPYTKDKML